MRIKGAFLFLLLLGYNSGFCQQAQPVDTLVKKYLSDTNNAAAKIKELTDKAIVQKNLQNRSAALRIFQVALSLAPYERDSFALLSKLHSEFAALLHDAKAEALSAKYYKTALAYQRMAEPNASSRAYNLIGAIGSHYLRQEEYDSSLYYFRLQSAEAKNTHISLWIAGAYNNTGILLFRMNNLAAAHVYYDSAMAAIHFKDAGDTALYGSITDNMAQLALREKDFAGSESLYKKNLDAYILKHDSNGIIKSLEGITSVWMAEKKLPEAKGALDKISVFPQIGNGKYGLNFTLNWFALQKEYYTATCNWQAVSETQNQLVSFKDSLNTVLTKEQNALMQSITAIELYNINADLRLYQLQLAQRESDLKITRLGLLATILFILSGIGLIILLLSRFKNNQRQQQHEIEIQTVAKQLAEVNLRNQQLEQERIQRELDFKKKDLSDLALYVTRLKDTYDLILTRLNQLKRKRDADHKLELHELTAEIDALAQSQEKVMLIQENVGQINKEFNDVLVTRFPELTKSEIELCGLLRLNMSNKEIGALKNISAESVKMARYRLRKKLNIAPEDDIYRFLATV